ncbi:type II toxin-antitoxin system Phd/YefM family antitoxin [Microcoleus sp. FACHB-SPT15]|uniref:type II toxin-antitoxin system Phd/YefM family antitoxin n=1 Tax=Microcoleus sp. FACHB-SPT15 TaxID=2692830 RepID=UPI001F553D28|nr:type II toxin-antitoxin system Phd/YefM family antitoxin [Microcoleus sp. FACHB-SPT15]
MLCSLIFPDGVVAIRELEKAIAILINAEVRSLIIDESLMSLNVTKLMAMIPINEAKQRLQDLIDAVSQSHQPIVITSQNSNAILLSEADWLAIQETLYLLSIPGMRESIRAGLATPIEECDRELEW